MKKKTLIILILILSFGYNYAQTKVSGYVFDEANEPVAFATILFKGSIEGTISDENGKFYLESKKNWSQLIISFIGYENLEIELSKKVTFNLKLIIKEENNTLNEVVIAIGKQPKKNNPAIAILEKIWKKRRQNGLKKFNQYNYKKYEKVEFDLNTIDSTFKEKGLFRGMQFVFNNIDTSAITGKTYLPVFLNESVSEVFGDNTLNKEKETIRGNKNTGFSNNQAIINFIDDLYNDYNIYDNYIKLLDYFPDNTKEGFKTEALPSIWENKDEFNALMQKASDDMIKLAKAIDTAEDLRAVQKDLMWNNCSACHNRFRAEH